MSSLVASGPGRLAGQKHDGRSGAASGLTPQLGHGAWLMKQVRVEEGHGMWNTRVTGVGQRADRLAVRSLRRAEPGSVCKKWT